jgi:phosphoribosylaminoimidazole-succinocarboxamide synthase
VTIKADQFYEGKAKKVFRTDSDRLYWVEYKDDATAFNGEKRGTIAGKGSVNNRMSNMLFRHLENNGISTHFVEQVSDRETIVHAVEIVPLEVVVRNVVAGSMAKRLGLVEGTSLEQPIVEFYYKDDALGDPLVTEDHIRILRVATEGDVTAMRAMALAVNALLQEKFAEVGVLLVDFKLEFGRDRDGELLLADEISPDTCRLWDMETLEKLDKDRFRRDLGGVEEAYAEMLRRLTEGGLAL